MGNVRTAGGGGGGGGEEGTTADGGGGNSAAGRRRSDGGGSEGGGNTAEHLRGNYLLRLLFCCLFRGNLSNVWFKNNGIIKGAICPVVWEAGTSSKNENRNQQHDVCNKNAKRSSTGIILF